MSTFNVYGKLALVDNVVVVVSLMISTSIRKSPDSRLLAAGIPTYLEALQAAGQPADWVLNQDEVSVRSFQRKALKPVAKARRQDRRNDRHAARAELRKYRV